jgi:hypothetical protein
VKVRRLSIARVASVAAWTAASVSWGTAAVAIATRPAEAAATEEPVVLALPDMTPTTTSVPDLPESGLVVLRYTPVDRPKPRVVTEVRVAPGSAARGTSVTDGSGASAPSAPAPAAAKQKTTTKSSGS